MDEAIQRALGSDFSRKQTSFFKLSWVKLSFLSRGLSASLTLPSDPSWLWGNEIIPGYFSHEGHRGPSVRVHLRYIFWSYTHYQWIQDAVCVMMVSSLLILNWVIKCPSYCISSASNWNDPRNHTIPSSMSSITLQMVQSLMVMPQHLNSDHFDSLVN